MNKKIYIGISILLMSSWGHALDVLEAYQRAQMTDPNWQANLYQYQADQLNLGIAQGALLPTVTLSGNITRKHQDMKQFSFPNVDGSGFNANDLVATTSTTRQIALTARQPLFRMDAWEGYKQVKTSVALSEVTLKLQQQQHILSVAEAYFNILRQQALSLTNVQEEKALLEQLNMMNAKLREGLVARSDVGEANAQYQNARANRIATGVQLLLAQEQLAQLIGPYQEKLAVLRDDFQYQKPIPAAFEDWKNLAQSQNLDILQARMQRQYAEDQRKVEKAALYPQLDAVASYGFNKQSPETMITGNGQFDQIGVEMNWNAFDGGRTKKSIQKAAVNVQKADASLDAAIRKANTDVKKSFLQVETDEATLQARKAALESSTLVSNASKAQYNEGLKSMVDVLLAQRNAFSAKQDYVNAQYDYVLNVLKLKASVGQLTEKDLQEMNAWLVMK
ncbi:TolC family outer membrane protein [Acinetobacter gerneri]|uniref:TolC family outer membrane protein n=1 Tax=Acinetobacter gerneri TaxID=202952 RepID=A0AAW8JH17_9GAMM|nr:TolC family outer membrane protein [Acinetobacter gerneri]MDQ9010359.1 TolC family outer membrane protein [Acinetobacter gerneri]MDQ9014558.1 TolC family outer membrane protein [Acinetobacter gerneri]MDQ9025729.1 TolC family outer membrane protein [Acinetobacter gerneri]MDQ9053010.1 TolC family outer membrane protein [Acinetobacter gerneri]MDQ9060628.1 TolC family outer membrane protein [Acinetobacter gerneri]